MTIISNSLYVLFINQPLCFGVPSCQNAMAGRLVALLIILFATHKVMPLAEDPKPRGFL